MLPKRKVIEVFEELSPQDNGYWTVPDGVYEVEFALVAGGLNGEYSDIYNAGSGGNGGGDGAGAEDTEGVTINGENGGNATYYGGGGGGASKASNSGATSGRGGSGYRGIIILHYLKNG